MWIEYDIRYHARCCKRHILLVHQQSDNTFLARSDSKLVARFHFTDSHQLYFDKCFVILIPRFNHIENNGSFFVVVNLGSVDILELTLRVAVFADLADDDIIFSYDGAFLGQPVYDFFIIRILAYIVRCCYVGISKLFTFFQFCLFKGKVYTIKCAPLDGSAIYDDTRLYQSVVAKYLILAL